MNSAPNFAKVLLVSTSFRNISSAASMIPSLWFVASTTEFSKSSKLSACGDNNKGSDLRLNVQSSCNSDFFSNWVIGWIQLGKKEKHVTLNSSAAFFMFTAVGLLVTKWSSARTTSSWTSFLSSVFILWRMTLTLRTPTIAIAGAPRTYDGFELAPHCREWSCFDSAELN